QQIAAATDELHRAYAERGHDFASGPIVDPSGMLGGNPATDNWGGYGNWRNYFGYFSWKKYNIDQAFAEAKLKETDAKVAEMKKRIEAEVEAAKKGIETINLPKSQDGADGYVFILRPPYEVQDLKITKLALKGADVPVGAQFTAN